MNTTTLIGTKSSLAAFALFALAACGGGGGGGGSVATFTVGGMVSGLAGSGLTLKNNGADNLTVTASGNFTFATKIASGAAYSVTVGTPPTGPSQDCVVTNGSGTMGSSDVTNVSVACSTNSYTVGGTVSGLTGSGLVLQDNAGDNLPISASGSFTFATAVASGAAYSVTVLTQPTHPSQSCTVSNGSGTVGGSNVTNVGVTCSTNYANDILSGTWKAVGYNNSGDVGVIATVTYDGAGSYTGAADVNANGTIVTGVALSGVYTVSADGSLAVTGAGASAPGTAGVGADGNIVVGAQTTAGQPPDISVGVKQGQNNFTNADLAGTYKLVECDSSGDGCSLLTLTFDGAGNVTGPATQNNNGTITTYSVTGTYTVAADGAMTVVDPGAGLSLSGGISADRKSFVLTSLVALSTPNIVVGIKQGQTNFNNASVKGTFLIAVYTSSGDESNLLTLTFDGAGNISGNGIDNLAGTRTTFPITGTYSVTADGALTVNPTGGTAQSGGISADGNTLVLSELTPMDLPSINVGIRQ